MRISEILMYMHAQVGKPDSVWECFDNSNLRSDFIHSERYLRAKSLTKLKKTRTSTNPIFSLL